MTSKITWRDEEKFTKALLRKMQSCTGEIRIFPQYTELDGSRRTIWDMISQEVESNRLMLEYRGGN